MKSIVYTTTQSTLILANLPEIDLSHDLSNLSHDLSYKLFLKQFDGKITNVIN